MPDPFTSPEGRAWVRSVEEEMVPKLRDSALALSIYSGGVDAKLAVELGAAVLLDKPIIICVQAGVKVPEKLVRIADRIIEADLDNPAETAAKIQNSLSTFGIGGQ